MSKFEVNCAFAILARSTARFSWVFPGGSGLEASTEFAAILILRTFRLPDAIFYDFQRAGAVVLARFSTECRYLAEI
jgi:hypothetical protein